MATPNLTTTLPLLLLTTLLLISKFGTSLPFLPPTLVYHARVAVSFLCLLLCAFYGMVASVVLRLVGYGGLSQWTVARAFKWTMWWATGVTFVVEDEGGQLKRRPVVLVGNHQSELDVLMLGCMFPPYCSVTAKKSLKWTPLLGQFMSLSKTVFIDRANRATARQAFDSAAHQMHQTRQSVFIFPEGTRSHYDVPDMLPFKKGAFHLAIQAGVPIVPVVVANYSHVLSLKRKRFVEGKVRVRVLEAVETKGLESKDVEDLMERVRGRMLGELVRLSEGGGRGDGSMASVEEVGSPS